MLPLRLHGRGWTSKMVSTTCCDTSLTLIFSPEVDREQLECPLPPIPPLCDHKDCGGCWKGYPQSRFPNWTRRQVIKSKIYHAIRDYPRDKDCVCYRVDVDSDGFFTNPGPIIAKHGEENKVWDELIHEEVLEIYSRPRPIS